MADENEALHVLQFTNNLMLRNQDGGGRFDNAVMSGKHYGKKAQVCDYLKSVEMSEVTGRNQEIVDSEVEAESRWVTPRSHDVSCRMEQHDEIRMIAEPWSQYPLIQAKAWRRRRDTAVLDAHFGSALSGVDGTTVVAYDDAYKVSIDAGGTGSALNVDKIIEALALGHAADWNLEENEEEIHCAIDAKQNKAMMRQIEVIHADYQRMSDIKVVKGFLREYKGVHFHPKERLKTDPAEATITWVPMWLKSGMYRGDYPKEIICKVIELVKRGLPKRLYTMVTFDVRRTDETKVIKIPCKNNL